MSEREEISDAEQDASAEAELNRMVFRNPRDHEFRVERMLAALVSVRLKRGEVVNVAEMLLGPDPPEGSAPLESIFVVAALLLSRGLIEQAKAAAELACELLYAVVREDGDERALHD
jgi:hypothetical protein